MESMHIMQAKRGAGIREAIAVYCKRNCREREKGALGFLVFEDTFVEVGEPGLLIRGGVIGYPHLHRWRVPIET